MKLAVEPTQIPAAQLRQLTNRRFVEINPDLPGSTAPPARHVQDARILAHSRAPTGNGRDQRLRVQSSVFDQHQ